MARAVKILEQLGVALNRAKTRIVQITEVAFPTLDFESEKLETARYLAVTAIVLGQGLLFGNVTILVYGALLALGFHIFVLAYEEPTLRHTFGTQFEAYTANVPRWVPRLQPWTPDAS